MHKIPYMLERDDRSAYYFKIEGYTVNSEITFYIRDVANWRHNQVRPNQELGEPMFSEKDRRALLREKSIVDTRGYASRTIKNYNYTNIWGVDIPWD